MTIILFIALSLSVAYRDYGSDDPEYPSLMLCS